MHWHGRPTKIPSLAANPVFDDRLSCYDETNPTGSVITPVTGTKIEVSKVSRDKLTMTIWVTAVPGD